MSALPRDIARSAAGAARLHRRSEPARLWLCIVLPELALVAVNGSSGSEPAVVTTGQGGAAVVYACNARAYAAGIHPGMKLNAALALVPALQLGPREPAAESAVFEALARWAVRYTPVVCIDEDALFLEVAGSLMLFGGLDALEARIRADLHDRQLQVVISTAVSATAAMWLARAGREYSCLTRQELHKPLAELPLGATGWSAKVQVQLQKMGIHTLGECARLPRDGFARRFGSACLAQLDRALGRGQEVFKPYQPAAVFNRHIDFGAELSAADDIQSGLQMLLQELRAFLVQRQLAARCVRIRFEYLAHPPGELILELRSAVHSTQQLDELLRLKFERYQLIAPVIGIRMEALTEALQSIATTGLLAGERQPVSSLWLFERLRARLGETAVHGLEPLADHRPEHAWQSTELAAVTEPELPGVMSGRDRPLWLLHEPVRLSVHEERPVYRGELLACGDVERIESGWWDGAGVKRSYFSARDTRQHRWWIYQDEQGWYLHGVFG